MEFSVKSGHPEKQRTACLVAGVFENRRLTHVAEHLDSTSQNFISNILRKGDLEGKTGQTLMLHNVPNTLCDRLLLVGCGKERELGDSQFRDIIRKMVLCVVNTGASDLVCSLTELNVKGRDIRWKIRQAIEVTQDAVYTFDQFKTKKDASKKNLRRVTFTVPTRRELQTGERALIQGQAVANAVRYAKDIANVPPNICTPIYFAKEAEKLHEKFQSISVGILDEKEIRALKMNSFLAVGEGSKHPPRLITLEYRGRKDKQKPVVLIGKGITFDTGGLSMKPGPNMIGMKYDMAGGAAVLATIRAAADMELPINLVAVIPSAENMTGPNSTRPEDVVTTMSGMTVEIMNTDAEGRLILCDALTYSERFDPEVVIDVATLTSAIVIALSKHASGLFSNHPPLANDLLQAGFYSGDRCWQLPIWDEYQEGLASHCADMTNVSNIPEAGSIVAACFLSRFAKSFHWAHLDVAGTASIRSIGKERGATGRPVSLLCQYLIDRSTKD